MSERQQQTAELVRSILGGDYLHLAMDRIYLEEDLSSGQCSLRGELRHQASGSSMIIVGQGVGFLDAFFRGLRERLATEYPSLDSIEIASFDLRADLETRGAAFGSDAEAVVELELRNSAGASFVFVARSRSITSSAAEACLRGAEYFVNSEKAFIMAYRALLDARERRRNDLEERYVRELAELVNVTSYTRVIDEIRRNLLGAQGTR